MSIQVVGLGPGDGRYLTREAWALLSAAEIVYLRTARHPAVASLPSHVMTYSFDYVYDAAVDFEQVYGEIVGHLLRLARKDNVIYAVPGSPFVGEATVDRLAKEAAREAIEVQIIAGLSFVEPILGAVGLDALDGLQVWDALSLVTYLYPPLNADMPLLLGQVYNRLVAGEVKQALAAVYPEEHTVFLVHAAGEANQEVESLPLYRLDHSKQIDHLTSLYVPPLPIPSTLPALAETVAILRSPEGCPWDIEQTPQSMRDGLLEEAYEVLAALDADDPANLREELGDLLYHIVMQAQMAAEAGDFTLSAVIAGIEAKLRRRHPHIWGDWQVDDTAEVLRNWEFLKQQEKGQKPRSILDGVELALPALARSQRLQHRAAKLGFDWPDARGVYEKIAEELAEIQQARGSAEREAELGDCLFALVNLARHLGVDAESALREANGRFAARLGLVERIAEERGLALPEMSLPELDVLWQEAKEELAKADTDAKV